MAKSGASGNNKNNGVRLPRFLKIMIITVLVLLTLCGAGILVTSIFMKVRHGDMDDLTFHIWVGLPVVLLAAVTLGAILVSRNYWYALVFVLSLMAFIVSAYGAVSSGLSFHENNWRSIYENLVDGECISTNSTCRCPYDAVQPAATLVLDCDELKHYAKSFIADITLCAIVALLCMMMVLFSISALFCKPWSHFHELGQYGGLSNNDFSDGVRMTSSANIGTYNRGFAPST